MINSSKVFVDCLSKRCNIIQYNFACFLFSSSSNSNRPAEIHKKTSLVVISEQFKWKDCERLRQMTTFCRRTIVKRFSEATSVAHYQTGQTASKQGGSLSVDKLNPASGSWMRFHQCMILDSFLPCVFVVASCRNCKTLQFLEHIISTSSEIHHICFRSTCTQEYGSGYATSTRGGWDSAGYAFPWEKTRDGFKVVA